MDWKYKANYLQSLKKWKELVDIIEDFMTLKISVSEVESVSFSMRSTCGFCRESVGKGPNSNHFESDCTLCPLYPEFCASYRLTVEGQHSVFWNVVSNLEGHNFECALTLAKKMLAKIESLAPDKDA